MPILRETLDLSADTPKSRHHENPPRFIIPLPLQSQMSEAVPAPMTDGLLPIQEAWADITLRDAPLGSCSILPLQSRPWPALGFHSCTHQRKVANPAKLLGKEQRYALHSPPTASVTPAQR